MVRGDTNQPLPRDVERRCGGIPRRSNKSGHTQGLDQRPKKK